MLIILRDHESEALKGPQGYQNGGNGNRRLYGSGKGDLISLCLTRSIGGLSFVLQASRCESGKYEFAADGPILIVC